MLIPYNNDFEKIVMGFMSYIPDLKEPTRIEEELEWYKAKENRKIYLWQNAENRNLIGFVGVEEEDELVLLRHIAIDPSFRNEGLAYQILENVKEHYPNDNIVGTIETANIVSKWQKNKAK